MNEEIINKAQLLSKIKPYDVEIVNQNYRKSIENLDKKIIVLDDDPTGVQTVNNVYVYSDWSKQSIEQGFDDERPIFYILTNSRSLTSIETKKLHNEIAKNIIDVSSIKNKDYLIISRSDSTLRGHYPIETESIKFTIENNSSKVFDGEIIIPFFLEGGRLTLDNVHYVADGEMLIPASKTEFATDLTFGYSHSHLGEWVEEKTNGKYPKEHITYISLNELRNLDYKGISDKLLKVNGFNKVVVNAIEYADVIVFVTALTEVLNHKNFLFRTAAAFPKVIGQVKDRELLKRSELTDPSNTNGGLVIVGSHVKRTTQQLGKLKELVDILFIEFECSLVNNEQVLEKEIDRVVNLIDKNIAAGKTVTVFTSRQRFELPGGTKEENLLLAIKISDAIHTFYPQFYYWKGRNYL